MNKTKRLDDLFGEWEKAHEAEDDASFSKTSNGEFITKDFFERDGIIEEDAFDKEAIKVLFISAEANADQYNAKSGVHKTDYHQPYLDYYKTGREDWKGKMKERLCGMYKFLTNQPEMPLKEAANKFAVMDINKRGGKAKIDKGKHIAEYARVYKEYIRKEIDIINPDIVVIVGVNLARLRIVQILGCENESDRNYFVINGKRVPILLSFQTANAEFQAKRYPPIEGCDTKSIGILCAKLKTEMIKYGIGNK